MGACLIGNIIFPIQYAKLEVLTQVGADNLYVVFALHRSYVVGNDRIVSVAIYQNACVLEIGEVLDVFNAYRYFC